MAHKIITITREYGSGGRLIAKKVAEALNIAFYDNELIDETARELGIDIDTIRKASQEKSSSFAYSLNNGPLVLPINDQVYATQAKIIKHLAEKEDCIIVNGCANYILEDYPDVLRIFVYAPFESRLNRVVNDYKEEHDNPKNTFKKETNNVKAIITITQQILGLLWKTMIYVLIVIWESMILQH